VEEIGKQVSQRRTLEAQLLGPAELKRAAQVIRERLEETAEVTEVPSEAIVRFTTAVTESTLGEILAELVQQRIPLTQFRELQTDLEEAFMTFANAGKAAARG
jgi:ABC-2 type transport system ATP-binding protein